MDKCIFDEKHTFEQTYNCFSSPYIIHSKNNNFYIVLTGDGFISKFIKVDIANNAIKYYNCKYKITCSYMTYITGTIDYVLYPISGTLTIKNLVGYLTNLF